jgi:FkbM family methyltransferase
MNDVVKSVGRSLRRVILPLVGQPAIMSELGRQRSALNAQEDALKALEQHVSDEIDRLDGYLAYHADTTRQAVAGAVRPVLTVGADLDAIVLSLVADVVVPTREEGLLAHLVKHGVEGVEPGVRRVLKRELRPGDVVVDAGASVGIHSVAIATTIGPAGRLLCFEPVLHIADALERTLRLNAVADRTRVHPLALWDEPGTGKLFVAGHSPMSTLFHSSETGSGKLVDVDLTSLDEIVGAGGRVDLVKIDVEGAEPRVWRGMARVREENPRLAIVMEWSTTHFVQSGESETGYMDEIRSDGFEASVIVEPTGALLPVPEDLGLLEGTNLLLRRGR